MGKVRIGIDPGKDGVIAMVHGDKIEVWHMPVCRSKSSAKKPKEVVDGEALAEILEQISERIALGNSDYSMAVEDVHAIYGSSAGSTFGFGYGVGVLHGILQSLGFCYEWVQPKIWQKAVWIGEDIVLKPNTGKSIKDTKATSIKAAKRLFPDVDLRKNTRCKVMHDGKADALLITHYLKQI